MSKAASAEKPAEMQPDKGMMLPSGRLVEPDFGWRTWEATIPMDTSANIITQGWFWRMCARRIGRGDHIRWRSDCLTRFGEIVIVAVDVATGNIEARELWRKELAPATVREGEKIGFTPADFGVHERWGIVRDADGHVMCKGIASFDEAMRRIRLEYLPHKPNGRVA